MCNKPNFRAILFILSVMGSRNVLLHIAVQFSSVCRDTLEKKESGVQRYHDMEAEYPLEFEKRNINVVSYNLEAKQANASATHDIM
jgi:hypothetical protein